MNTKTIDISSKGPLDKRKVLVVNNDPDIFESLERYLDVCRLYKASDIRTAMVYLEYRLFDIVIWDTDSIEPLDLSGNLLKKGIPTVFFMEGQNPDDNLNKYIKQGAVPLPNRNNLSGIKSFLEGLVQA